MPAKSKKSKAAPIDDFDDIIAEHLGATVTPQPASSSSSSGSGSSSSSSGKSRSSTSTTTKRPTEEAIVGACIDGNISQLRRWAKQGVRVITADPLIQAASYGLLDVLTLLVKELGAEVNNSNENGTTALHAAAMQGQVTAARCLVKEFGANINQPSKDGVTPTQAAAQIGNVHVLRCLVEGLGADITGGYSLSLFIAAGNGHLECVQYLVEDLGVDINHAASDNVTALIVASFFKHTKLVRWLIKNGANTQAIEGEYGTAADISKARGASREQTAYLETRTHCTNPGCGGAGLKKCAGCLEVYFCSRGCQLAHWPTHKADCKRRVEAKASDVKASKLS